MEEQIVVDTQSVATPFPHIWEHMFDSCHASMTLCEDWRKRSAGITGDRRREARQISWDF